MKGRTPTRVEKEYHDALCQNVGCVVCWKHHDCFNDYCSIHHIDGRTKAHAHLVVLPLCGQHHQIGGGGAIPVHPTKARFEREYGTQMELKEWADDVLRNLGIKVPELLTSSKIISNTQAQRAAGYYE